MNISSSNESRFQAVLFSEIEKMESCPKDYMDSQSNTKSITPQLRIVTKLVRAWAYLQTFAPEKALRICDEALKVDALRHEGSLFPIFNIIKASALATLMRLKAMKQCLDEAQQSIQKTSDMYTNLALLTGFATYYTRTDDIKKAESIIMKVVNLIEKVEAPYLRADVLMKVAMLYKFIRKPDIALKYFASCLQLCEGSGYMLRSLQIYMELIAIYTNLRQFELSDKYYRSGIEACSKLGLPVFLVGLNFNYGLHHKVQGKLDDAIHYYLASLEQLSEVAIKIPLTEFNIYNNLANALSENQDGEQALEYHYKAEALAKQMNNHALQMQSSNNIGLALIGLKRYDEAITYLKKPRQYYRKTKNWELLVKVLRTEAFMYQESKNYKKGFKTLCKLDEANMKLIAKVKSDQAVHYAKALDTVIHNAQGLQKKFMLAEQQLVRNIPNTFIGVSAASHKVVESAKLAALYPDTCVFIEGESGTGKEIVARMIHAHSSRSNQAYVTVNCASISPNLFESEFFGHIKGSFTGANQDKQGFFQLANNGTLFLDEISEMPMEFQAKLLRAIDTKTIIPVGKGKEERINCKIIAATNHNIHKLILEQRFRLDLYHRINTIEINIPALCDRMDDLPVLLDYFVKRFAEETKKPVPRISQAFIDRMSRHSFPGNVRELKNYVERLFVMHFKSVWDAEILDNISTFSNQRPQSILDTSKTIKQIEADMIMDALSKCNGKQSEAAKLMNMTESTFSRKMKRLGIPKAKKRR